MDKQYLYLLLAIFIFINGVEYFKKNIKESIKQQELLKYKLKKQELYSNNIKEIESILKEQKIRFLKNRELFFNKNKKETIIFSEIQQNIQKLFNGIAGKIEQLNSGVVLNEKLYKKYPISLDVTLIPEDLDIFFKKIHSNKKYLFVDSIHIFKNRKKQMLELKIRLIGYQLK